MAGLPAITPIRLVRLAVFGLKWDGFRAISYIEAANCRLVSRNGNTFKTFPGLCEAIAAAVGNHEAILDGEIVALDAAGRAQFYPLLHRKATAYYYAFDCLWLDGRDLRGLPLLERKQILQTLVPPQPSRLLYVGHIEERGADLFRAVCEQDIEGIVAKKRDDVYDPDGTKWFKIKNPTYSQAMGRHERFERMRRREGG